MKISYKNRNGVRKEGALDWRESVSYTHLDVYKRQVLNLQMTELFMREIYFHQKLFPVLEKLEI